MCINRLDLLCFKDRHYLCVCNQNHTRAECFGYDDSLDKCSYCLAGGRCLKENSSSAEFRCLCPHCYSGKTCEFNLESFSFTLDQLFSTNLASKNAGVRETTVFLLLFGSWLFFLIGLPNNLCSFVTFHRIKCRRTGAGHYLRCMSIANQINLGFFALRLTHLVWNTSYGLSPTMATILCKVLNYLLVTSSRVPYWLVAVIAIERVYITLVLHGQWLKKPSVAKRFIGLMLIAILISGSYELFLVGSYTDYFNKQRKICLLEFPRSSSLWTQIHQITTVIHTLLPFAINLSCTIAIVYAVFKKKLNLGDAQRVCK